MANEVHSCVSVPNQPEVGGDMPSGRVSFVALLPKVGGVGPFRGAGVFRRFVAENYFDWLTALSGIPRAVWNTNVILLMCYYLSVIIQVIE